jgi:hypothetical protein
LDVAADGSGGAFVVWTERRTLPPTWDVPWDEPDLFAQHVNADGSLGGTVVAVSASLALAEVQGGQARLEWVVADGEDVAFRVERSGDGVAWEAAGFAGRVGSDRVRFVEPAAAPGTRRAYRLAWWEDGTARSSAPVWLDAPAVGGLRCAARAEGGRLRVEVTGAPGVPAMVEVLDVQGRVRARAQWASDASGRAMGDLGDAAWTPGLYLVRATQAGTRVTARVVVVR